MPRRKKQAPVLWYRGTQSDETGKTVRGKLSFTPCLGAAVIWSAVPGDVWRGSKAHFLPSSTVAAAHLDMDPVLRLPAEDMSTTIGDVLRALKYSESGGITHEESLRIYNYLHNRLIGKAAGGEFLYRVYDVAGQQLDEQDLPFSIINPMTLISQARDEFEYTDDPLELADEDDELAEAERVAADTFIFADAPIVQKVAERLGFRGIVYQDAFAGGEYAAKELLGIDVFDIDCVETETDLEGNDVPTHLTARPLPGAVISYEWARPAEGVAAELLGGLGSAVARRA